MKISCGSVLAILAGTSAAAAAGAKGKWRSNNITARHSMDAIEAKTNLKFAPSTKTLGYLVSQPVRGKPNEINDFITSLTFTDLKSILEPEYGYPFCFYFYNIANGDYTGGLCGHFTSTAEVKFDDSQTRLPYGAISPRIDMQPSVAPQPVTVTASQQQSDRINKAGKVTDEDLHELLGGNYGKPFKILTKGSDGGSGGSIAGSFGTRGAMFEDHSKLPSRRNTSRRYNNGMRAAFTRDAKFDDNNKLPSPPSNDGTATEPAQNVPTDAPAGPNTGFVTPSGSPEEIENQLNNLSYDYLLTAVGGKYGPFYITLNSEDDDIEGYIEGEIYKDGRYSYKWAYTYKAE